MLYCLYRISDKGNLKTKLPHATKFYCLSNFINVFGHENLIVVADNCGIQTISHLSSLNLQVIQTSLGNGPSFQFAIDYALKKFASEDYVYFIEDDYLHLPFSKKVLLEGLAIADYVTLYDGPDKYVDFANGGDNHFIIDGGESTKVLLTKSAHWKITNSTTMTFACKVKTLKEDLHVWNFFQTQDYLAFQKLSGYPLKLKDDFKILKNKLKNHSFYRLKDFKSILRITYRYYQNKYSKPKRKLISSIPGRATHAEMVHLAPLTDWTQI